MNLEGDSPKKMSSATHVSSAQPRNNCTVVPLTQLVPYGAPDTSKKRGPPLKNITGIYIGKNGKPSYQKSTIPPLIRSRAMGMTRAKTPTEKRRYRKVEQLRIKEEKRGFSGNPVKRKPVQVQQKELVGTPEETRYQADFWNITSQTSRNFTAATNSGCTRLEYLNPDPSNRILQYNPSAFKVDLKDTIAGDILTSTSKNDMVGLVECYKKVCNGNVSSLQSLLTQKKKNNLRREKTIGYLGSSNKSFQKLNHAEIIAHFPTPDQRIGSRPQTVQSLSGFPRPFVPSPSFYKKQQAKSAIIKNKDQLPYGINLNDYDQDDNDDEEDALGFTGFGPNPLTICKAHTPSNPPSIPTSTADAAVEVLNRSHHRKASPPPPTSTPTPYRPTTVESQGEDSPRLDNRGVESSIPSDTNSATQKSPHTPESQDNSQGEIDISELDPAQPDQESVAVPAARRMMTTEKRGPVRQLSGAEIVIGVEDHDLGEKMPVEIDTPDDEQEQTQNNHDIEVSDEPESPPIVPKRRVSITERILKTRNSEQQLASITEKAESRKKELAVLLTEHAQIVQEVTTMEGNSPVSTPGADKENATFGALNDTSDEKGK